MTEITKLNLWYISKYIAPASAAKVGARGFLLLQEMVKLGHKTSLFTSDSNHLANSPHLSTAVLHQVENGVDVYWLRTKKYQSARSLGRMLSWLDFEWRLWRMPKKNLLKPDVVIVSSLSLLTIVNGLWLRKKYGCKLVFEVRDIWPLVLTETGELSKFNPFVMVLAWIERLGYKRADVLVGTMPNFAEHVRNVLGKERAVACIPQGIDPSLLKEPNPLTAEYVEAFIPKDKFIVCHAGSIGADNALETLFACARAMHERDDIHFLIVGDGYLKAQFQEETKDLTNITFAPRVEKAAVQSVLAFADVVYFAVNQSPIWRFGQSLNKVTDYMLSGKPIVASYTGFPSMVNEADCGTYVPAEDADALRIEIEKMAALPLEKRTEFGSRGRGWLLKNRSYESLASDYLKLIQ